MPARRKPKAKTQEVKVEIRHRYSPGDQVKNEGWKELYPKTDPLVQVSLDAGTFQWLWDFVDRKGRQADAGNFRNYSPILGDTYRRGANQFALAAQEAFGDTYKIETDASSKNKPSDKPAEAPETPLKRRKRRKPVGDTSKSFNASEGPTGPVKASKGAKPENTRSQRRKRRIRGSAVK